MPAHDGTPGKGKRSSSRNAPAFDRRTRLFQMCGVDLTRCDGINVTTALALVSETGADLSRFKTGGKVRSAKTKRVVNRAAQALRLRHHCALVSPRCAPTAGACVPAWINPRG